jgi:hypothetical protein
MPNEVKIPPKRGRPSLKHVAIVLPEWRSTAHALDVLATIAFPVAFENESGNEDVGDTTLYLPDPYSDRKVELLEAIVKAYGLKSRRGKRVHEIPGDVVGRRGVLRWRPLTIFGPRAIREVVTATYEYSVAHADDLVRDVLPNRPLDTHKRVYMNNWWDGYTATITPMVSTSIEAARSRTRITGEVNHAPLGEQKNLRVEEKKPKGPSHARKILPQPVSIIGEPGRALVTM